MNKVKIYSFSDLMPIIMAVIEEGDCFPLAVKGNSMYPFLREGKDKVVFSSLKGRTIKRGDIILFQRKNCQYIVHRVYKIENDNTLTLVGDNQVLLEKGIKLDQVKAYVGSVVRNGREIDCEQGIIRWLMTVYMIIRVHNPVLFRKLVKLVTLFRSQKHISFPSDKINR